MEIANHSKNREPALSILVLKLPTVKGKRRRGRRSAHLVKELLFPKLPNCLH